MAILFIDESKESVAIKQGNLSIKDLLIRDVLVIISLMFLFYCGLFNYFHRTEKTEIVIPQSSPASQRY